MTLKRKRFITHFFLNVAASTFIGICVYGIIVYGENPKKISPLLSFGLGCLAVLCVVLIFFLGTALDKLDAEIGRGQKKNR